MVYSEAAETDFVQDQSFDLLEVLENAGFQQLQAGCFLRTVLFWWVDFAEEDE